MAQCEGVGALIVIVSEILWGKFWYLQEGLWRTFMGLLGDFREPVGLWGNFWEPFWEPFRERRGDVGGAWWFGNSISYQHLHLNSMLYTLNANQDLLKLTIICVIPRLSEPAKLLEKVKQADEGDLTVNCSPGQSCVCQRWKLDRKK